MHGPRDLATGLLDHLSRSGLFWLPRFWIGAPKCLFYKVETLCGFVVVVLLLSLIFVSGVYSFRFDLYIDLFSAGAQVPHRMRMCEVRGEPPGCSALLYTRWILGVALGLSDLAARALTH